MRRLLPLLFIVPLAALSQSPGSKPAFEVIAIKANSVGRNAGIAQQPGGRFVASEITLRRLFQYAYRGYQQFIGGPSWLDTDRWDIEAKAAEGAPLPSAGPLDMAKPDQSGCLRSIDDKCEEEPWPIFCLCLKRDQPHVFDSTLKNISF